MSKQNKPGTSLLETFKDEIAGGKSVAGALVDLMKGIRDTVAESAQSQGQEISQAVGKAISNIDGLVNEAQAAVSEKDTQAAKDADAQNVKPEDIQKIVADVLSGNTPNETGLKVGEATTDGEYFTAEGSNLILGKLFLLGLEIRGLLPELHDFVFERIGFEEREVLRPEIINDNIDFIDECDTDFSFIPIKVNEDTAFRFLDHLVISACPDETTRLIEICIPGEREHPEFPHAILWNGEGTPPDNLFDPNNNCACDDHEGQGHGDQVLVLDVVEVTPEYTTLYWVPHDGEWCLSSQEGTYVPLTQEQLEHLFIYPPQDSDLEFILEVTLTSVEADGEVHVVTHETEVNVLAVADTPCVSVTTTMGIEDPEITLNPNDDSIKDYSQFGKISIDANLQDNDGSEYLSGLDVKGILTGSKVYIMGADAQNLGLTIEGGVNGTHLYLLYDSTNGNPDGGSDFDNFIDIVTHTTVAGVEEIKFALGDLLPTPLPVDLYVDPPADYPSEFDSSMQIIVQVTATERATGEDVFLKSANSEDNDCAKADLCFKVDLDIKDIKVTIDGVDVSSTATIVTDTNPLLNDAEDTFTVAPLKIDAQEDDGGTATSGIEPIHLPPITIQTGEATNATPGDDRSEFPDNQALFLLGETKPSFSILVGGVPVEILPPGSLSGVNQYIALISLQGLADGKVSILPAIDSSDDIHFNISELIFDESADGTCLEENFEIGHVIIPVDIQICPVVDDLVVVSIDGEANPETNYLGSGTFDEDADPNAPMPITLDIFTSIQTGEAQHAITAITPADDGSEVITKLVISGFLPGTVVNIPGYFENILVTSTDQEFTIIPDTLFSGNDASALLNQITIILPQVEHVDGPDADDCPDEVDGKIPDLVAHIKYVITVHDTNLNTIALANDDDSCPDATKDFTYNLDITIKDINKDPVIESSCHCDQGDEGCLKIDYQNLPNFNFGSGPYADAETVDGPSGVHEGSDFSANSNLINPGLVDLGSSGPVNATVYFQHEGAGFLNTLGYYLVDHINGAISNVHIIWSNASADGSGGSLFGDLNGGTDTPTDGTHVDLGAIPDGYSLGFFMLPNAASVDSSDASSINHYALNPDGTPVGGHFEFRDDTNGDPASLTTTPSLYFVTDGGPQNGLAFKIQTEYNSEGSQGIWHTAVNSAGDNSNLHIDQGAFDKPHAIEGLTDDGLMLVTFEDLINGGDKDFEDLMFYVKMEPVSALCDITVTDPDLDCIMKAVVTLCGLEGDKFLLPQSLDEDGKDSHGLTWVLNEDGTVLTITGDAEPEVYSQILDALLSWDGENNNLGGQIEIQPAMDDNGPIPGERTVKYVVYDQLADLEGTVPSTDPHDGISLQKECCFDLRNHLPPEVTIEKHNGTEDQRDAYIQLVSIAVVHPATEDLTSLIIHDILPGTKLFIDPADVADLHLVFTGSEAQDDGLYELNSTNFSNVSQMGADLIITYNPADNIDTITDVKLFVQPPADYPTATDETLDMTLEATSTDGVTDKSTTDDAKVSIQVDLDMSDIKVFVDLNGGGPAEHEVTLSEVNPNYYRNFILGDVTPTTPAFEDGSASASVTPAGISIPKIHLTTGESNHLHPDDLSETFTGANLFIYVAGTGGIVPWDPSNLPKVLVNDVEVPLGMHVDGSLLAANISMAVIEAGNIKIVPPKDSSDNIRFDFVVGVKDASTDPDSSIQPNFEDGTVLIQGQLIIQPVVDDLYVNGSPSFESDHSLGIFTYPEDSDSEDPAVNPVTITLAPFASIHTGEEQHAIYAITPVDDGSEVITKVVVSGFILGMVVTIPAYDSHMPEVHTFTVGDHTEFTLTFLDGKTGTEVAAILNAITIELPQVPHTDSNPEDDEDCNDTAEPLNAHIQYVITVQDDNHNEVNEPQEDSPVTKDFTYTVDLKITDINKDPVIEVDCNCDCEDGPLVIDLTSELTYQYPPDLPDAEDILDTLSESTQFNPTNNLGVLEFVQSHDVTVYFHAEGAGYRNTLGYYFIDENGVMSDAHIIWPNSSADGSGGNLLSDTNGFLNTPTDGTSFNIGNVPVGAKLGFFLLPDAFSQGGPGNIDSITDNDGNLSPGHHLAFLNDDMSPATLESVNPKLYYVTDDNSAVPVPTTYGAGVAWHTAGIVDGPNLNNDPGVPGGHLEHAFQALTHDGLLAIGFEDLQNGGDQDYNDLIFFVDIGPANANTNIELCQVTVLEPENDCIVKAVVTLSEHQDGDKFLLPQANTLVLQNGHTYHIDYDGSDETKVIITGDGPKEDYDLMLDVLLSLTEDFNNGQGRLEIYLAQTGNGATEGERKITYVVYDAFADLDGTNLTHSDGISNTGECCFTIENNLPPLAHDDKYCIDEDGNLVIAGPGLLGNDTDPDGGPNPLVIVSHDPIDPSEGTLIVNNTTGGFDYTPPANFSGCVDFNYTITDGTATSTATAMIFVKPIADVVDIKIDPWPQSGEDCDDEHENEEDDDDENENDNGKYVVNNNDDDDDEEDDDENNNNNNDDDDDEEDDDENNNNNDDDDDDDEEDDDDENNNNNNDDDDNDDEEDDDENNNNNDDDDDDENENDDDDDEDCAAAGCFAEDGTINVPKVSFQLTDTDGSETAKEVRIYFDPDKVDHFEYPHAFTLHHALGIDYITIPVSGTAGDPALLENSEIFELTGLKVVPHEDSSDNFTLTFKMTNTDTAEDCDGNTHTDEQTSQMILDVCICPVVDDGAQIKFDNVDEHGVCVAEDATVVTLDSVVYQSIDLPDFRMLTGEEMNAGINDGAGDQSEQFTYLEIQIPNIPEGSKLFVKDLADNLVEIGYNAGTHTFGPLPSEGFGSIEQQLDTLQIMLPKDWSGTLDLNFKAKVTDTDIGDPEADRCAPDVSDLLAIGSLKINVESVIDQPLIQIGDEGSQDDCITVCEDESINVPSVKITATDVDGSEALTQMAICFEPGTIDHLVYALNGDPNQGFVTTQSLLNAISITLSIDDLAFDPNTHSYSLNGLQVFPAANSDRDIKLTFKATVSEIDPTNCGDIEDNFSKEVKADFNIKIMPAAEIVNFDQDPYQVHGDEDNYIQLTNNLVLNTPDNDGSEEISKFAIAFDGTKVDAFKLSDGTTFSVDSNGNWIAGGDFVNTGGNHFTIVLNGNMVSIETTSLVNVGTVAFIFTAFKILPAKDSSDDFNVTLKVTSTDHDTEGHTYPVDPNDPDCVPEKVSEFVIPVSVCPVVDDLHLNNSDFAGDNESNPVALEEITANEGDLVSLAGVFSGIRTGELHHFLTNITTGDDGSEKITDVTLVGFPVGAIVHINGADVEITEGNKDTPLSIGDFSGALNSTLDGITITLPEVDAANLSANLIVKFTVVDDNHNNSALPNDDQDEDGAGPDQDCVDTKDFFFKIPLAICNVDTAPTLAATPHVGTEDKNDAYIKIVAAVGDSDPSEHLKSLKIDHVPDGSKLYLSAADVVKLGLALTGGAVAETGFYELNATNIVNFATVVTTAPSGAGFSIYTINIPASGADADARPGIQAFDVNLHVKGPLDFPSSGNAHMDLKVQVVSTDSGNNDQSSPLTPATVLFNVDLDISDFKVTFDNVVLTGGVASTQPLDPSEGDLDNLNDILTFGSTASPLSLVANATEDQNFTMPKIQVQTGESQHLSHPNDLSEGLSSQVTITLLGLNSGQPKIYNESTELSWSISGANSTVLVSMADLNSGKITILPAPDSSNDLNFRYSIGVLDETTDSMHPNYDLGSVRTFFAVKVLPVVDNMFINGSENNGAADQALGNLNGVENTPLALNVFTNIQTGEAGNATPGDDGSEKIIKALLSGFPAGAVVHANGIDYPIAGVGQTIDVNPPTGLQTWKSVLDAITVKLPVVNTPTVDFDVKVTFTVQDDNHNNLAAPDDDTAVTRDFTAKFHVTIADGNHPPEVTCVVNTETIDQTIPFEFQGGQLKSVAQTLSILNEGTQLNADYINNLGVIDLPNPHPVKVHFFNEGAGFKNSFGYYLVAADGTMGDAKIIWNNASTGSGEPLVKGDDGDSDYTDGSTFDIGTLPAGSHLAFFLLPDAFSESGSSPAGQAKLTDYTLDSNGNPAGGHFEFRDAFGNRADIQDDFAPSMWFIPDGGGDAKLIRTNYPFDYPGGQKGFAAWHTAAGETNAEDMNQDVALLPRGHVIQALTNDNAGLILMGFEDLYGNKASNDSDEDYNDILFFVEVGPANVQSNAAVIDVTVTDPDVGDFINSAVVTLTGVAGDKILAPTPTAGFTFVLSNNDTVLTITGVNKTPADFSNLLDTSISSDNTGGSGIELLLAKGLNGDYVGGLRTLDYVVTDNHGAVSQHDTCDFTVTASVKPTAIDDTAHADEDMPVIIKVLANDTDPTNQALSLVSVTNAAHGTVTMNADGTIKYTPGSFWDSLANGVNGTDSFDYVMKDADGNTDTGHVDVTIHGAADRAPANDVFPLPFGTTLDPDAPDALKNILLAEFLESNLKGNNTYFDGTSQSSGTAGNDVLLSATNNTVGGTGQDYIESSSTNNDRTYSGDAGNDILYGSGGGKYTFNGGDHGDVLIGGSNSDTLSGDAGNDFLAGGGGADTLNGGAGNDILLGGDGADKLFGNDGNDTFFGGAGNDEFTGGNGNDLFVYDLSRNAWGNDVIHLIGAKANAGDVNGDHIVFANVTDGSDAGTTLSTADLIAAGYKVSESGLDVFIKNDGTTNPSYAASEIKIEGIASTGNYNTGTEQAKWDLLTANIHVDVSGTPS